MEQVETECTVIGAGVIGLAIARALVLRGREVAILEAEDAIGTGNSSRNSEVIHAGIYYPTGSLKARACVGGRELLYDYCRERGIAHRRLGKLIVATHEAQLLALATLEAQARANGVLDLQRLTGTEARALEPPIACAGALLSPSTGIIDSRGLMLSLLGEAQAEGAMLALGARVEGGRCLANGACELEVAGRTEMRVKTRFLVNAAGLGAPTIARSIQGFPEAACPPLFMAKGNYFTLSGKAPFSRLVYPLPEQGGLGIHLTLDLAGQARFGPDVEWVDHIDYRVDPARAALFEQSIRRYWPELKPGALVPAHAGIRPKVTGPGEAPGDFAILGPAQHGILGQVHLFGIESPGLTACLAIAEHVAGLL